MPIRNVRFLLFSLLSFYGFILTSGHCYGQKLTHFQTQLKVIGDQDLQGCSVLQLADRGFILGGMYDGRGEHPKILIARTDSLGKVLWSKTYGGNNDKDIYQYNYETPYFFIHNPYNNVYTAIDPLPSLNMIIAPDSSIVICTSTLSYGTVTPSFYLMKIDKNGKILWGKAIGAGQVNIAHALINAPGGGFVMAGYTCINKHSNTDSDTSHIMIIKTNDTGGVVWCKTYSGSGSESALSIATTQDGGYLVGGTEADTARRIIYGNILLKTDKNGNLLWSKAFQGSNHSGLFSVVELPDRSIYVCGRIDNYNYPYPNPFTTGPVLFAKLDSVGSLLWSKNYEDTISYYENYLGGNPSAMVYNKATQLFYISANLHSATGGLANEGLNMFNFIVNTSGNVVFMKEYTFQNDYNGFRSGYGSNITLIAGGGYAYLSSLCRSNSFDTTDNFYLVKADKWGTTNYCDNSTKCRTRSYPMKYHTYNINVASVTASVVSGYASSTIGMTDTSNCPTFIANFRYSNYCSDTIQFYDSTYQYPISWQWDFGDPGSSSNISALKNDFHIYSKPGTYSVKLIAYNGAEYDTITKKIIIGHPVFFKSDTLICGPNTLTLKANGGTRYLWHPGKLVSDSTAATTTATLNKTITFIVDAIGVNGCITKDTVHISVDNKSSSPKIDYATVKSNSEIDLKFQKSDSNDVKGYEVFRSVNDAGYSLIQTINNLSNRDSFYFVKDSSVNAAINKYSYKILAVDSCGAISDTSIAHQSMLLAVKQLGCVQTLQLNWSSYVGWSSAKSYEIYRNVNAGLDSLIATLAKTDTTYNDTGLNNKNIYCYKILALDNADSFVSQSNIICKQTFFPDTPRIVSVSKISTSNTNGIVVIKWSIINKTNLAYYELFISRDQVHFDKVNDPFTLSGRIPASADSLVQNGLDTKDSDYYYYLVTVDSCGAQSIKSPVSKTMTLKVSVGQLLHKLNWTPYVGFKVREYQIQRFEKGQFMTIDSVPGTDTSSREFPAPCNYAIRYRIAAIGYDSRTVGKPVEISWSDTMGRQAIDTIPSDPPVIQNATILNGSSAKINFISSDSLDTYDFVIQRSTDGNWNTAGDVLFTKPGEAFTYVDSIVNTVKNHICYTIIARDSCLNASSSDTICLQKLAGSGLFCTAKAQLDWPTFSKPPSLPDSLFMYRSVDDIHFKKTASLTPKLSRYADTAVSIGMGYYYTVSTIYKSGMVSYSDTIKIIPEIIPEADSAQLVYATVIKSDEISGAIYIKWKRAMLSDTNARGYYLYSYNSTNGKYALLKDITDLNDTTFINSDINTIKDIYKYYVITYNVCDVGINSNIHRTVLLNVQNKNLSEQLNWIYYLGVPVKNYSIYKSVDGGSQNLVKNVGTDSSYLDSDISCNHNITYQIQAILSNGEISFSDSVTVKSYDSIKPVTRPIVVATVIKGGITDGRIKLSWNGAMDNNLLGYNVYRSENGFNWQLIVGRYPSTSLIDSGLDTYDQSYYYKIQPVDSCGNTGTFTIYHETVDLIALSGNGYNLLSWNGYVGWQVKKYLVYRDGILIDTIPGNVFKFKDTAIICHTIYQYLIKAVDSVNDTIISASNTDSAKAANHIPPQKVYIKTVTVSKPNKAASISWTPSKSYDVKDYLVYRKSAATGDMKLLDSTINTNYIDTFGTINGISGINKINGSDCYYVFARDHCGNISDGSNEGCIIILDAKALQGSNQLTWNSYQHWPDGVQSYNVYKNEDSTGWQLIGTTSSPLPGRGVGGEAFTDKKLGDSTIDFCYQVEAIENPGQYNQLSRSTVECVHQDATVFIPNSFTPYNQDGVNDLFGPKGIHIKSYDMKIYNRWGELVYASPASSRSIGTGSPSGEGAGWDGTFKGQPVQQGIYIYMITVTDYNGKQSYFKGTVTMFE